MNKEEKPATGHTHTHKNEIESEQDFCLKSIQGAS
jgi:hypothetical protein